MCINDHRWMERMHGVYILKDIPRIVPVLLSADNYYFQASQAGLTHELIVRFKVIPYKLLVL
jgi:hypothetical protein